MSAKHEVLSCFNKSIYSFSDIEFAFCILSDISWLRKTNNIIAIHFRGKCAYCQIDLHTFVPCLASVIAETIISVCYAPLILDPADGLSSPFLSFVPLLLFSHPIVRPPS